MSNNLPSAKLKEIIVPIERPEIPIPGKDYRQLGVKLWGEGAYERESIDGSQTKYKTLSRVQEKDIVVNKIWARNGTVAVVPEGLSGCFVSGEFPTFNPIQDILEPRWFHWLTKTKGFWRQCDEKSQGTSGKNRIRPEKFLEIEIPLPAVAEQRRIVARIEELAARIEEARELRRRAVEETEALPNSQLSSIFNAFFMQNGLTQLDDLIVDAGYGTSTKCTPERLEGAFPVLRIPNVASERVNFGNMKYGMLEGTELNRTLVSQGDVLVVRTNGSADLVGRCAVVPNLLEPIAFASYLIRLKCNINIINPNYLQLMLKYLRNSGQLFDFARTTAGQYNVSLGRLRSAKIPIPPLDEQCHIISYLDRLQSKLDALKRHQAETAAELDALLPAVLERAFRGEL